MATTSDFSPKRRLVSNVTVANPAVVTTTEDHEYDSGLVVRLFVPSAYGMNVYEEGTITVINTTSFSVTIDTSNQLAFSSPTFPGTNYTQAQVIPISGVTDNEAA